MSNYDWTPSSYQHNVFADLEDDDGNTVVVARAGCAKTSTMVRGTEHIPPRRRTLLCAFNRSIKAELARRAPRHVDVKTLHSAGMSACRRAFGDFEVDENKTKELAGEVLMDAGHTYQDNRGEVRPRGRAQVAKLVGLAKNTLTNEDDEALLTSLAIDFDLDRDPGTITTEAMVGFAAETLRRCAEDRKRIDFDDMVWFPARHGLKPASYDVVLVDECQDLNAAQLYLIQALRRRGGRIVAVGDERQAIYQFRGADQQAMGRLIQGLSAKVLPLPITYRCPLEVVRYVQQWCPDLEAAPGAQQGVVRTANRAELDRAAQPGDFVLSRSNAPLLKGCLRFLARGIPACVAGRDVGKALIRTLERAKTEDLTEALRWVQDYTAKEARRYRELERDEKALEVEDTRDALLAVSEGLSTVEEVKQKVGRLFRDDDPQSRIVFSTVHKAKGLERDRVWLLEDTFRKWGAEEEQNIYYVAATRARRELVLAEEPRA